MNERIQELVGRAKFMAEETINKKISKNAELDAFAEKFAELIVHECATKIVFEKDRSLGASDYMRGRRAMADSAVFIIKKHFGVDE